MRSRKSYFTPPPPLLKNVFGVIFNWLFQFFPTRVYSGPSLGSSLLVRGQPVGGTSSTTSSTSSLATSSSASSSQVSRNRIIGTLMQKWGASVIFLLGGGPFEQKLFHIPSYGYFQNCTINGLSISWNLNVSEQNNCRTML